MVRRVFVACSLLLSCALSAAGFDVVGKVKSVDAEKGTLVVFANGQDRNLTAEKNLKVLDADGKDLADGLKAPQLKLDAEVTITVQPDQGRIRLSAIRLGAHAGRGPGQPRNAGPVEPGKPSVGLKPLNEMTAEDRYKNEDGGLYGGGKNEPPEAHAAAAKKVTAQIVPLDREGKPSPSGKIGLISMSMSNATQEFSTFKRIADADSQKSPRVAVVDCAQGGQTMAAWARPDANCWKVAMDRLSSADVAPEQVQVIWVKLANAGPSGELDEHGQKLYDDTLVVLQLAKERFPNLKIAYLGSRIYAGYANTRLNPEPYAYEGALVVRWLIRDQVNDNAAFNYDAEHGKVRMPLLLWGPYFWGDGMTPRKSDGLVWERDDLGGDGTHPSASGQRKVADMLLSFFKNDADAKTWFVGE